MTNEQLFEQVNSQTDIVELVSEFVKLDKRGKNYVGLCPFHDEKTPSFTVNAQKNIAHCFGCKMGGNPVNFFAKIKAISPLLAAKELAERLGIKFEIKSSNDPYLNLYQLNNEASLFYETNMNHTVSGKAALEYLTNRGISVQTIKKLRVGFASNNKNTIFQLLSDKGFLTNEMLDAGIIGQYEDGNYYDFLINRISFPIINEHNNMVGFCARSLLSSAKAKYINTPDSKIFQKNKVLYNLNEAKKSSYQTKEIIIHEGVFDVATSIDAGILNVVATLGTALSLDHIRLLKKHAEKIVLAYDSDEAGIASMFNAYRLIARENMKVDFILLPKGFDPNDYYLKYGKQAYVELFSKRLDFYLFAYKVYSNIDFKDANLVTDFKAKMKKVLFNAPLEIKKQYVSYIKNTHGIEVLNINVDPNEKIPATLQTNINQISTIEYSELKVLNHFFLTNRFLEEFINIMPAFGNVLHFEVFQKICEYYEKTNDERIDPDVFILLFPEYDDFVRNKIINQNEYIANLSLPDFDELKKQIDAIEKNEIRLKISKLTQKVKEAQTLEEKQDLTRQITQLTKALHLAKDSSWK